MKRGRVLTKEKSLSTPSIEYLAGFFDGEGCVSTSDAHNHHPTPKVHVGQLTDNAEVLERFQQRWGGAIVAKESYSRSPRLVSRWQISGPNLVKCLHDLLPHLRQKRRQAYLALVLHNMVRPHARTERMATGQWLHVHLGDAWLRRRIARAISNLNHGRPVLEGTEP